MESMESLTAPPGRKVGWDELVQVWQGPPCPSYTHWGQCLYQVMLSAGLGPVQGSRAHRHLPGREVLG